jgi:hypothetical protein
MARPVRAWRFLDVLDWLPVLVTPFVIYWLTEGFTQPLSAELWLIIGIALLVNLGWIGLMRGSRRMLAFHEKYPGFGVKK